MSLGQNLVELRRRLFFAAGGLSMLFDRRRATRAAAVLGPLA